MFNPNPDPADVQKAKEALKVCFTCNWALPETAVKLGYVTVNREYFWPHAPQ